MSSIITFTSCSKWNHLNRTSLFSVVAVWRWCLPKRAECRIGTSICSKKSITSARPDRARFHVVFPWSNYHNFPVKKCNENHFGLRNYNTWCQPFPNKFHGLRAVCVQWFQRQNTISPRTLGPEDHFRSYAPCPPQRTPHSPSTLSISQPHSLVSSSFRH